MAEHITRHDFALEIDSLQQKLSRMGTAVAEMLTKVVDALEKGNASEAGQVEDMDDIVDRLNMEIEADALRLLALQQPMARDLRTIAAALKIITDVERAGDYAFDIARIVIHLVKKGEYHMPEMIPKMAGVAREMICETMTAFKTRDLNLVSRMIAHDAEVDSLFSRLYEHTVGRIQEDPQLADEGASMLFIGRYLERMADHMTNVGERIYYMETGELKELHT
jgi:phosphate transport system protein